VGPAGVAPTTQLLLTTSVAPNFVDDTGWPAATLGRIDL
jgi:hypothetical protein